MTNSATAQSTAPAPAPAKTGRRWLYMVAVTGIAAVLLWRSVEGLDWRRMVGLLATVRLSFVAGTLAIGTAALLLRALRWRVLLRAEADVRYADAIWATAGGYLGNNFLPARAGELVRTVMISRRTGLSNPFVLTTALSERMLDALTLVLLTVAVAASLPVKPAWLTVAAKPFAIVGLCGLTAVAALPRVKEPCRRLLLRAHLPPAIERKLLSLFDQVVLGLESFHNAGRLFRFAAITAAIWSCEVLAAVLTAQALGLALPVPVGCLFIACLGLGSAIPSTPGYVGVYQFIAVTVLGPFGFMRDEAVAFVVLLQALGYITITIWGLPAVLMARKSTPAR